MKTVLVLGASVSQLAAIRAGRALGLRVIVVDGDPDAVGFPVADIAETVDFSDRAAVIEVARRHRIDGVVAISSDRAVPVAAAVAEALGLPGVGVETARAMTDKGSMRRCLARARIPQPRFAIVEPDDDLDDVFRTVGAPAVMKPIDSGGQRGLFFIDSVDGLREHLPASLTHSPSRRVIVERFVDGSELNVIAVVIDGEPEILTLSDRLRPVGPGFGVGWAHLYPSRLPAATLDKAGKVATEAIKALGLRNGIAFPQLLATDDEVVVVEVAARIAAGQMADLVRLGIGVDLVRIAFAQALGEPVAPSLRTARFQRTIAIRFLTASPGPLPSGVLKSMRGLDGVRAAPGVLDADLYLQLGEMIKPVQVDADRRGYIITTAQTPDEALVLADEAAQHLVLETVELERGHAGLAQIPAE